MNGPAKPVVILVALQIANRANGGIESFTQLVLRLTHFRPVIVTNLEGQRTEQWRAAGIETHVLPERASRRSLRKAPFDHAKAYATYARKVLVLARAHRTRLVYANDPLAMQFVYPLAVAAQLRVLFAMRNMPDPGLRQSKRKFRALINASARMLYLSKDMATRWEEFCGRLTSPYSVTYSIVDEHHFNQPWEPGAEHPFVLFPARITPPKRQLEFIKHVAPALAERGIRTLLAGDASAADEEYDQVCRVAAAPLGGMVEFLGFREDLPALFARANATVVGARLECLARAMIESMACGCPVVSSDVCSAEEVLSPGGGVVVPTGDWEAMASALLGVCEDRVRSTTMSEAARATARRLFNGGDVIARYEDAMAVAGMHGG